MRSRELIIYIQFLLDFYHSYLQLVVRYHFQCYSLTTIIQRVYYNATYHHFSTWDSFNINQFNSSRFDYACKFQGSLFNNSKLLFKIEIVIVPSSTMGLSKETFILHKIYSQDTNREEAIVRAICKSIRK